MSALSTGKPPFSRRFLGMVFLLIPAGLEIVCKFFELQHVDLAEREREKAVNLVLGRFQQYNRVHRFGGNLYAALTLLDADGQELTTLKQSLPTVQQTVHPQLFAGDSSSVRMFSDEEGMLIFSHPVVIDQQVVGFVQGRVQYDTLVKRVAAMKEFSHPGNQEKVNTDINHSLQSTLVVCRNEWKYVAELVTDLAEELPLVPRYVDQLHQALVNLVEKYILRAQKGRGPHSSFVFLLKMLAGVLRCEYENNPLCR